MPLLLTMALCGSVGTLIYFILSPLTTRFFSLQWRRIYLICCILCYLIPFPCILTQYKNWIYKILSRFLLQGTVGDPAFVDITNNAFQVTEQGMYMRHALMYLFFAGVLIIGTIIFVYHARKYYMFRKYFQNNTNVIADEREQEIIQAYISKNNIDKSIRVYEYSDERVTPITMGVIEPIIILPKMDWTKQDLEFVMEHEVTHIRQRDNLIKFLAIVVAVLNFYNPLAFYLLNKWEEVAEMTCDSKVLAGKSQEEVSRYGNLIIDLATMKAKNKIFPILGLSLNFQKKAMEERIHTMKKEVKKEGLLKKALGIGTLGVALFISSLPVMAYSPKKATHLEMVSDKIVLMGECASTSDDVYVNVPVGNDDEWVLVDESGQIVATYNKGVEEPYLFCNHEYKDYTANAHTSLDDGGCIVNLYKANRCSKCGDFNIGELINTITYAKCPHK